MAIHSNSHGNDPARRAHAPSTDEGALAANLSLVNVAGGTLSGSVPVFRGDRATQQPPNKLSAGLFVIHTGNGLCAFGLS